MSEIRGSKKLQDAIGKKPPNELFAWEMDGDRCVIVLPQLDRHGVANGRSWTNVFRIGSTLLEEITSWYDLMRRELEASSRG